MNERNHVYVYEGIMKKYYERNMKQYEGTMKKYETKMEKYEGK